MFSYKNNFKTKEYKVFCDTLYSTVKPKKYSILL